MPDPRPIILVLGPTAGGKTRLALELARRLGGECVCADSMQIYRGMDIGTAKPTAAERAEIPHHLLDLLDPSEDGFSVDAWLARAQRAIADIRDRRRYPIVVGGTSLYVQALLEGLFEGPEPDPQLRATLEAGDAGILRRRLEAIDPAAAQRIHPNDRRRTIRALEVYELTGRRISDLQQQWSDGRPRRDVRIIGLDYDVEAINARINARVRQMIADGLVEEVRRVAAGDQGQSRTAPGRQAAEALGYRQIMDHLAGRVSLDDAVEEIKIRTRRLARQQRAWLKRFRVHPDATWIPAGDTSPQLLIEQALAAIGVVAGASPAVHPARRGPESVSG